MRERFIIHINVADFAATLERRLDPRLRRRPLLIAPRGTPRAVIYDMSEEAYQSGVRKGMALRKALRRCPGAHVLPPQPHCYEKAVRMLVKQALPYTPLVEVPDSRGHLFLDVTGTGRLFGPPPDLAWRIRKRVRAAMGLDPIWSVGPNKLVAKVATRVVKPSGEYIVGAGEERAFLDPVPVHLIPGVEAEEVRRLLELNLTRAGEVARLSEDQLTLLFGRRGRMLHEAVHGIDPSPLFPLSHAPPVVTVTHLFGEDAHTLTALERALFSLVEQAGAALRRKRLAARRMRLSMDYSDGIRISRKIRIVPPSANDFALFPLAAALLKDTWKRRVRIRRLSLTCRRLTYPPPVQQDLFLETAGEKHPKERLIRALDAVRSRFGEAAVRTGRMLAA